MAAALLASVSGAMAAGHNDHVDFSNGTGGWVGLPMLPSGEGSYIDHDASHGDTFRTLVGDT